jgi:hypothetical protein
LMEARSPLCFQAHDGQALMATLRLGHGLWQAGRLNLVAMQQSEVARSYGTWDEAMSRLMGYYVERHASGRRF